LNPGDFIIQNACNSAVGVALIQFARQLGLKTINVFRGQRTDYDVVMDRCKILGGYVVVPDLYQKTYKFRDLVSDLPKPKLAVDGLGGPAAEEIARYLQPGSSFVSYAAATNKPIHLSSSALINNQIKLAGFWLPTWIEKSSTSEKRQFVKELVQKVADHQMYGEKFDFEDFDQALKRFQKPQTSRRVIIDFNPELSLDEYPVFPKHWLTVNRTRNYGIEVICPSSNDLVSSVS